MYTAAVGNVMNNDEWRIRVSEAIGCAMRMGSSRQFQQQHSRSIFLTLALSLKSKFTMIQRTTYFKVSIFVTKPQSNCWNEPGLMACSEPLLINIHHWRIVCSLMYWMWMKFAVRSCIHMAPPPNNRPADIKTTPYLSNSIIQPTAKHMSEVS